MIDHHLHKTQSPYINEGESEMRRKVSKYRDDGLSDLLRAFA